MKNPAMHAITELVMMSMGSMEKDVNVTDMIITMNMGAGIIMRMAAPVGTTTITKRKKPSAPRRFFPML